MSKRNKIKTSQDASKRFRPASHPLNKVVEKKPVPNPHFGRPQGHPLRKREYERLKREGYDVSGVIP